MVNATKAVVADGYSQVLVKSVSFSNTDSSTSFIPSGTPVTATVGIVNPEGLDVVYSLGSNLASGSFSVSPPAAPSPTSLTSLTFTFTLTAAAEWKDVTFRLGKLAPSINKTFSTDSFTIHCDSPPDPVGTLVIASDKVTANAFMAFTLPEAEADGDLRSVVLSYQDKTAGSAVSTTTLGVDDPSLTTNNCSVDPLCSVSSCHKRYFMPAVTAGHIYGFTVAVVDNAGQKSPTSAGSTDKIEYTVTFDNNYSGAPGPSAEINFPNVTMALPVPDRTGYAFTGWNTAADGSGTAYTGTSMVNSLGNATLYAQWTKLNTVAVTIGFGSFGVLSFNPSTLNLQAGSSVTISSSFSGTGWHWYLDGIPQPSWTGLPSVTYTPASPGSHILAVTAADSSTGITYSANLPFTVTQ